MTQNKNISTSIKDLFIDSDPLKLEDTSFMFGLSLSTGATYQGVDDTYLTPTMTFVGNLDGTNDTEIPYRYCSYSDFPHISRSQLDQVGITNSLCPDLSGVQLLGNSYNRKENYINIVIKRCVGTNSKGTACKSQSEIDEYVDKLAVNLFICSAYFDFDDYNQPIKYFLDNQFYFKLTSGFTKVYQLFVRENIVDDSNSIFQLMPSNTESKFISVENYNVNFRKEINNMVFRCFFVKEPKSVTYQRSVLTFLDCCGFIGGVNEILRLFGMLIVSSISGRTFIFSILSILYQVSNHSEQNSIFDANKLEVPNKSDSQQFNKQSTKLMHSKDSKTLSKFSQYADQFEFKQNAIKQAVNEMK